jgi:hypothetical protein
MNELDRIGMFLMDLPVYLANGGLVIAYWLAENSAALVSLLCAILLALLPDAEIQQRAGFRPRRNDRSQNNRSINRLPRTAQTMTVIVFTVWLIAQWDMGAPVPWIGAAMWVGGLLAVLALSVQRFNLLWYVKAGIAFNLAVIGSRIYLNYTAHLLDRAALIGL